MRFTGSTRSKFYQVIVFLNEGNKAEQIMELLFFRQFIRFITGTAEKQCHPFILGKICTSLFDFIQIQVRHLDGFKRRNLKRRVIL